MYPHTDKPLRDMPLTTKGEAIAYVRAYKDWLYANGATGNGAFLPARSVPATVRAPDLLEKARQAYEMAELNYWQMPYERAKRMYWGLPFAKWKSERERRGLESQATDK